MSSFLIFITDFFRPVNGGRKLLLSILVEPPRGVVANPESPFDLCDTVIAPGKINWVFIFFHESTCVDNWF